MVNYLTDEQIEALVNVCDNYFSPIKERLKELSKKYGVVF